MKKVLYFVLSILGIIYIFSLSAAIVVPTLEASGWFGSILYYFNLYGGAAIVFLFAAINFSGNIFKIILNIILMLVSSAYIVVTFIPEQIAALLGLG